MAVPNVFNLSVFTFNENWEKIRFTINGKLSCIGAEYRLKGEKFLIKPKVDIIGGYSITYGGNVYYFKNARHMVRDFGKHWQDYYKTVLAN